MHVIFVLKKYFKIAGIPQFSVKIQKFRKKFFQNSPYMIIHP